jgi:hypothetical protein
MTHNTFYNNTGGQLRKTALFGCKSVGSPDRTALQVVEGKLRGKDLNLRPLGYEPNELPLLHPALLDNVELFTIRCDVRIVNGAEALSFLREFVRPELFR